MDSVKRMNAFEEDEIKPTSPPTNFKIAKGNERFLIRNLICWIEPEDQEGMTNYMFPDSLLSEIKWKKVIQNEMLYQSLIEEICGINPKSILLKGPYFIQMIDEKGRVLVARGAKNLTDSKEKDQEASEFFMVNRDEIVAAWNEYKKSPILLTKFEDSRDVIWFESKSISFFSNLGTEIKMDHPKLKKLLGAEVMDQLMSERNKIQAEGQIY